MRGNLTMIIMMSLYALLGTGTEALAANGSREDGSMLLVSIFLGMCALIVIVQLLPAVLMAFGMIKGLILEIRKAQAKILAPPKK